MILSVGALSDLQEQLPVCTSILRPRADLKNKENNNSSEYSSLSDDSCISACI